MRDPAKDEPIKIGRLKRRADFVHAAKGRRWHGKAMTLQSAQATAQDAIAQDGDPRVGFTLTRKVGCSVVRNRARRRLREAVRLGADLAWRPGHDYVIIGRIEAIRLPFDDLQRELERAIRGAHGPQGRGGQARAPQTRPERTRPSP